MCSIVNQSTARKSDQSEVAISGRLSNQKPRKRTNQKAEYKKKQPIDSIESSFYKKQRLALHSTCHVNQNQKTRPIKVITKLPNSEQSYKGKVKTHKYINRQNQSTTGKLWKALAVTFAKDQTQALNIPVKVPLGGGRYAELTEWNCSKRVDLRFWETDTIPTNVGVSLSLPQWKVLYSAMQMVADLISWVKDVKPVDWRNDLYLKTEGQNWGQWTRSLPVRGLFPSLTSLPVKRPHYGYCETSGCA